MSDSKKELNIRAEFDVTCIGPDGKVKWRDRAVAEVKRDDQAALLVGPNPDARLVEG